VSGVTVSRVKIEGENLSIDMTEESYRRLAREYYITPSHGDVISSKYIRTRL
jgi:hypothetical protein